MDGQSNGYHDNLSNGHCVKQKFPSRATELESLLVTTLRQVIPFAQRADDEVLAHKSQSPIKDTSLVSYHSPPELTSLLTRSNFLSTPNAPLGPDGFASDLSTILQYSVNTLSPGFMDKLYSAPVPPGIAADLILAVLNTNLHVYQVSPVLTLIEKHVTKSLATLFGLTGPRAGGINVQGGSASNSTSIVIARNTLFPRTKVYGNAVDGLDLVLFTSQHGHYSIEKAALAAGLGSANVIPVPVDDAGAMIPSSLESLVLLAKEQGKTPFYVNATAGTTVLGSFDPFSAISAIARKHRMWLHIDGAWGGSFIFSDPLRKDRLRGCELADSIAINPHKMMGVPVTCSFLLARDLKQFHDANTLRAGYLFHDAEVDDEVRSSTHVAGGVEMDATTHTNIGPEIDVDSPAVSLANGTNGHTKPSSRNDDTIQIPTHEEETWHEPDDLADLTLQCGRRGDSLKLFLSWRYYGTDGYREKIESAYAVASHMAQLIAQNKDFILVSRETLPCLQVCFYYAPRGRMVFGSNDDSDTDTDRDADADTDTYAQHGHPLRKSKPSQTERPPQIQIRPPGLTHLSTKDQIESTLEKYNSKVTQRITRRLVSRGFMIDFAPALEGQTFRGKFFRAVVNIQTPKETVERLVGDVHELGREVVGELRGEVRGV